MVKPLSENAKNKQLHDLLQHKLQKTNQLQLIYIFIFTSAPPQIQQQAAEAGKKAVESASYVAENQTEAAQNFVNEMF